MDVRWVRLAAAALLAVFVFANNGAQAEDAASRKLLAPPWCPENPLNSTSDFVCDCPNQSEGASCPIKCQGRTPCTKPDMARELQCQHNHTWTRFPGDKERFPSCFAQYNCPTAYELGPGMTHGTCTSARIGSICQLGCAPGYLGVGLPTLQCVQGKGGECDAYWDAMPDEGYSNVPSTYSYSYSSDIGFRCVYQGCVPSDQMKKDVETTEVALGECGGGGGLGDTCYMACKPGYWIQGTNTPATCTYVDGKKWWTGYKLTCIPDNTCPPVTLADFHNPPHATLGDCNVYGLQGDECRMGCEDGWEPSGGVDSAPVLDCEPIGYYSTSTYTSTQPTTSTLTSYESSLRWQGGRIKCVPAKNTCPALVPKLPVVVGTCTRGKEDAQCTLDCAEGFIATNINPATCKHDGGYDSSTPPSSTGNGFEWVGAKIKCVRRDDKKNACEMYPLGYGVTQRCPEIQLKDQCEYACMEPYICGKPVPAVCSAVPSTAAPTWHALNGATLPLCYKRGYCGTLTPQNNKQVGMVPGTCVNQSIGSPQCFWECGPGYQLAGALKNVAACVDDGDGCGVWSTDASTFCKPRLCDELPKYLVPVNGDEGNCGGGKYAPGQQCHVQCASGYTRKCYHYYDIYYSSSSSRSSTSTATDTGSSSTYDSSLSTTIHDFGACAPTCTAFPDLFDPLWVVDPTTYTACVPAECPPLDSTSLPTGVTGDASCGGSPTQLNTFCSYACANGYMVDGTAPFMPASCVASGDSAAWAPGAITCNPVPCTSYPYLLPSNANYGSCTTGALYSSCSLGCNNGYQITSYTQGYCQPSAPGASQWSPATVTCSPVNCPAYTNLPRNATVGTCTSQVLGSTCALRCAPGYNPTMNTTATCTATSGPNAAWVGANIICTPTNCSRVSTASLPNNARNGTCQAAPLGATCLLACADGFTFTGAITGTCSPGTETKAQWVGQSITCNGIACAPLTGLATGVITYSCLTQTTGYTCNLNCSAGYVLSAYTPGVCTATSASTVAWIGQTATCDPLGCTVATGLPANAVPGSCTTGALNTYCTLGCTDGYQVSGTPLPGACTGTSNGAEWQGQTITCAPVNCTAASIDAILPANAIRGTCTNKVLGGSCTIDCANGYSNGGGLTTATCTTSVGAGASASWTGTLTLMCNPVICAAATVSGNGALVNNCTSKLLNTVCAYSCQPGFSVSGYSLGRCTAQTGPAAAWVGQTITCNPATCAPVTSFPTNGAVGNCTAQTVGSMCALSCASGFFVTPGSIVIGYCNPSGTTASWSGMSVACTAAQCGPATPSPSFSTVGNCTSGPAGSLCALGCQDGYSASSVALGSCQLSGTYQWIGQNIVCSAVNCPAYQGALNTGVTVGTCTGGRALNQNCAFACANGYTPQAGSSAQGTCLPTSGPNAAWMNANLICNPVNCTAMTNPDPTSTLLNNCTSQVLGSYCELTCAAGYKASGLTGGICSAGTGANANWAGATINCVKQTCAAVVSGIPPGGSVGNCTAGGVQGTLCTFSCNLGYKASALSYGVCTAQGNAAVWLGQALSCTVQHCSSAAYSVSAHQAVGSCIDTGNIGQICYQGCQNGYYATTNTSGTCTGLVGSAAWQGQSITCAPSACVAITTNAFANANAGNCSAGSLLGTYCTLACNDGYSASGIVGATCVAGSGPSVSWSTPSITCLPVSCAAISGLPASQTAGNCSSAVLGSTCLMGCANGYAASGIKYGVCAATSGPNARWTNNTITCTALTCGVPNVPSNAVVGTCTAGRALNSICYLGCANGYTATTNVSGTCTPLPGNAAYQGQSITCSPVQCTAVNSAGWGVNGAVGNCTSQTLNSICILGCADGYTVGGFTYGSCQAGSGPTASWTGHTVTCNPVNCPVATSLPSKATAGNCTAGRVLGSTCYLGCQDGYQAVGNVAGTCIPATGANAVWNGQAVTCQAVSCNNATGLPANANKGSCGLGLLGTSCTLGCVTNYALQSFTPGTCVATTGPNAVWAGQSAVCVLSSCGTVSASAYPTGGNVGNCSVGSTGDFCYLGCNSGYITGTVARGVCTLGSPSAWVGMSIQCTAATCAAASPIPSYGLIGTCTSGGTLGSNCAFTCTDGFYAASQTAGTCQPTGPGTAAWTNQDIVCQPASCPTFSPLPNNANIGNCSSNTLGSVCRLNCASGYVVSNLKYGTCVAVGAAAAWSGVNITCTPAQCPAVSSFPTNGAVGTCTAGFSLTATCLLSCISGYTPGSVVAGTCNPAGPGAATWNGMSVVCTAAQCAAYSVSAPMAVGTCTNGGALTNTCQLTCTTGYTPTGANTATCQGCGVGCASWQTPVVTCTATQCVAPVGGALPSHATAGTCGTAAQGNTCQPNCANGYVASGIATATCVACGVGCAQWTPVTVTCTAALCPAPSLPSNAVLGSCVANGAQGTNCVFDCQNGYQQTAFTQGTCQAGTGPVASWVGQSITCSPAQCAALSGLTGGRIAGSCGNANVGTTCTMGCANGYSSSAINVGTCQAGSGASASWVNMSIVCTPASCTPLSGGQLPVSATTGTCGSQVLGTSCALDCQYGYININGPTFKAGTCTATGPGTAAWSGQNITCVPPGACTTVNSTVFGANGAPGNCTNQADGSTCKLACQSGYFISAFTYGRCNGFTWTGMSITCSLAVCTPPSAPANGNVGTCSGVQSQGSTCNYGCNPGYGGSGNVQGTCTADVGGSASWKNLALVCSPALCAPVTGLPVGVLAGTCGSLSLGSSCDLTCANGYVAGTGTSGTCTADAGPTATWQNYALACLPASCDPLTPPLNAVVGTCDAELLGSTCNFTCQNGYSTSGVQEGTCVPGGGSTAVWTGAVITCLPASCATVTGLAAHQNVGSCTLKPVGSTCMLGCDDGYTAVAGTATCTAGAGASANWVGLSVTCTAANCAAVASYPSHAGVGSCTAGGNLGGTCSLTCNNGFIPSGLIQGVCAPSGPTTAAWVNQTITCTAAQCAAATPPSGALVGSCTLGNLGSTCQFACQNGYSPAGLTTGQCQGSGASAAWVNQGLTCTPVMCSPAAIPSHGLLNTCGNQVLGSSCTFDCVDGYQPANIGTGKCTATVGANAQWVNASISCVVVGTVCATYTTLPANGAVGTCFSATVDSTCQLGCVNGYVPIASTGRCVSGYPSASWSGLSVTCTPAQCIPPATFSSHALQGSCGTGSLGDSCDLTCDNGYIASQPVSGTCVPGLGPTAIWSGQSIVCSAAACTDAPVSLFPAYGAVGSCQAASLGASCNLGCQDGTTESGDSELQCLPATGPNAAWSGTTTLTCTPMQCDTLRDLPANGQAGNCTQAALGSSCVMGCKDGFALSNGVAATCQATSATSVAWLGASGTCTAVNCGPLTVYPEHALPGSCGVAGALDATCKLECDDGFTEQGSSPGTCTAGNGAEAAWVGQTIKCAGADVTAGAIVPQAVAAPPSSNNSLIMGIVGAAIGLCLLCLLLLLFLFLRRKKEKQKTSDATVQFADPHDMAAFNPDATVMHHTSTTMDLNSMDNPVFDSMSVSFGLPPPPMINGAGVPATQFHSVHKGGNNSGSSGGAAQDMTTSFGDTTMSDMSVFRNNPAALMSGSFTFPTPGPTPAFETTRKMELNIQVDGAAVLKKWEDFDIIRELGVGACGVTSLVREKSTYTDMALKVLKNVKEPEQVEAFVQEASKMMNLHHQFVIPIFGVMNHDGEVGLLMEHMAGGDLRTAALKLPKNKRAAALADGCKGLAYLHTRNFVHGDVKPNNILLDAFGAAKLADFGLTGVTGGAGYTERYAAPEVMEGARPTAQSDVYSYGLTIAEVFIGKPPFAKSETLRRGNKTAQPYDKMDAVPAHLRPLVERCLNADPMARPSPAELIEALNQ